MAAHAVIEVRYSFFLVLFSDLCRVVFMATVAGVRLKLVGVADPAFGWTLLPMIDRECMSHLKPGGFPGSSRMTGLAIS